MWKLRRARYANASSVAKKLLSLINYDHHAYCLSPIQITPGYVNEILAIDMERVKPENPELKR